MSSKPLDVTFFALELISFLLSFIFVKQTLLSST